MLTGDRAGSAGAIRIRGLSAVLERLTSMSSTDPSPLTLRSFWHDLPREGKLLLSVVVFEFIGTGLVLPFNVVYLHEVRGFALSDVGPAARRCRR